jgi:hypothetical protein
MPRMRRAQPTKIRFGAIIRPDDDVGTVKSGMNIEVTRVRVVTWRVVYLQVPVV